MQELTLLVLSKIVNGTHDLMERVEVAGRPMEICLNATRDAVEIDLNTFRRGNMTREGCNHERECAAWES